MTEHSAPLLGHLRLSLRQSAGCIASAEVKLQRPLAAISQLLVGESPAGLLARLPLLFSLCAGAQQVAAVRALEQAVNWQAAPEVDLARAQLAELELLRESLLRLVQDWQFPLPLSELKVLIGLCQQGIRQLQPWLGFRAQPILHDPQPLAETLAALISHWTAVQALDSAAWLAPYAEAYPMPLAGPLPEPLGLLSITALLPALRTGQCHPEITGQPRITGPVMASQVEASAGQQIGQRLAALWQRADQAVAQIAHPPLIGNIPGLEPGEGLGRVKTARGCLLHRVRVIDQQVREWQMLAPTDWNFHPQGVLARQLTGLSLPAEPAEAETLIRALVLSIDPCVGFELCWEPRHA